MAALVLCRPAHVDELQIGTRLNQSSQLSHANLWTDGEFEPRFLPGIHSPGEITLHIFQTDPRQTHLGLVHLWFGIGDNRDRRSHRNQRAGPGSELTTESDIERNRNMTRAKFSGRAHVENHVALRREFANFTRG